MKSRPFAFAGYVLLAMPLTIAYGGGAASAQTSVWQAGTGSWTAGINWTAGVPTINTLARIANGGTARINLFDQASADRIELGALGNSGELEMSGGSLNVFDSPLYVGYFGTGSLRIAS